MSEAVPSHPKIIERESNPAFVVNGNSHKDEVITLDDYSSDTDIEIKGKDSDSDINVESLVNEMNLEDLIKHKVCFKFNPHFR